MLQDICLTKQCLTGCVDTTVAVTGTWRTVAVAVPRVRVEPEAAGPIVTPLAPATPLVAIVTVAAPLEVVVVMLILCPCFCGMTPRPGMIRMVVPLFESPEETVEKVLVFWSAMVTARVGIRRIAVSPAAFKRVVVPADPLLAWASPDEVAGLEVEGDEGWGGVTWSVADMLLQPPAVAVPSMSGVSLTVVSGDLVRVAIMSGVIRSTVCPLASVVMEEGGRWSTSFPWILKLVAVIGIPAPP